MRASRPSYVVPSDRPVKVRLCDSPDCGQAGDFRAPKSRDHLNDYYFFCLDHVRAYNKQWDFFAGLSPGEVENYTRDAGVWERPSWPLGQWGVKERALRDKAMRDIFGVADEAEPFKPSPAMPVAEREAMAVLELTPPTDFKTIKAQYRALVKQHHPDLNGGDPVAEAKFKNISQAFTILRKLYEGDQAN